MNKYMMLAIDEARKAFDLNEVPVGAVIVSNNNVISCNYNRKNLENISVYHAEILAIIDACKKLNTWHLDNCEIYVTLKPCRMCLAAIAESRIKKVYYLLESDYDSNLDSNCDNIVFEKIDDNEYSKMLKTFFDRVRNDIK